MKITKLLLGEVPGPSPNPVGRFTGSSTGISTQALNDATFADQLLTYVNLKPWLQMLAHNITYHTLIPHTLFRLHIVPKTFPSPNNFEPLSSLL